MPIDFDAAAQRLSDSWRGAVKRCARTVMVSTQDLAELILERNQLTVVNGMQADKIDGMESDLHEAVRTAYRRGAKEWTRLNYPTYYERLSAEDTDDGH